MTINHFGGYLTNFTNQPLGYVSAAEGFVFLSGFLCLQVYGNDLSGYKSLITKGFKRSFKVYKYHIFLVTAIPLISFLIPKYIGYWRENLGVYYSSPIKATIFELFFLHQPEHMDILPMYCMFFALFPIMLIFIKKDKIHILFLLSFSLWILGQYINPLDYATKSIVHGLNPGFFNLISWQFIFVLGIMTNYYKEILSLKIDNKKLLIVLFMATGIFFLVRHSSMPINHVLLGEKSNLPAHRLINFALLAAILSSLLKNLPKTAFLPFFEFLGRYSLQAFSFQILLIYLLAPVGWRVNAYFGPFGYSIYVLIIVFSLPIPTYLHNKFVKREVQKSKHHT